MDNYFGYGTRSLYKGEDDYFRQNPNVSGMATEDSKIIFNPYSKGINRDAVGQNEAARLFLREQKLDPEFDVTPEQAERFKGTPYETDPIALKHTILGRIVSGDPSAGQITQDQKKYADWLLNSLNKRYGNRQDGTPKGKGFLGELKRPDGKVSTELSIGVSFDGQEKQIPALVPTLTKPEIDHLLRGGKPTEEIIMKSVTHAKQRMSKGLSPFND